MKKPVAALFLAILLALPCASGVFAAGEHGTQAGHSYVQLADWARANNYVIRRPDPATVELTNRWARLAFNIDSRQDLRRAEINGVSIWLAHPLLLQNGGAYISETDLANTVAPVLSPPANPPGVKIKTICLDPGHGGKDPGERVGWSQEKKYTLLLAEETRAQLQTAGLRVVLTRSSDVTLPLPERTELAHRNGADLFVCLHFNAFPTDKSVRGVETYCCTPAGANSFNSGGEGDTHVVFGNRNNGKNMLLAFQLQKSIATHLPVEDRGVKRARYEVLCEAEMPAILIEGGFMTNPAEGRKIADPAYRRQMARAIVEGILAYKKAVKG